MARQTAQQPTPQLFFQTLLPSRARSFFSMVEGWVRRVMSWTCTFRAYAASSAAASRLSPSLDVVRWMAAPGGALSTALATRSRTDLLTARSPYGEFV